MNICRMDLFHYTKANGEESNRIVYVNYQSGNILNCYDVMKLEKNEIEELTNKIAKFFKDTEKFGLDGNIIQRPSMKLDKEIRKEYMEIKKNFLLDIQPLSEKCERNFRIDRISEHREDVSLGTRCKSERQVADAIYKLSNNDNFLYADFDDVIDNNDVVLVTDFIDILSTSMSLDEYEEKGLVKVNENPSTNDVVDDIDEVRMDLFKYTKADGTERTRLVVVNYQTSTMLNALDLNYLDREEIKTLFDDISDFFQSTKKFGLKGNIIQRQSKELDKEDREEYLEMKKAFLRSITPITSKCERNFRIDRIADWKQNVTFGANVNKASTMAYNVVDTANSEE
ncbi:MAG: hypothetical protein MJZ34_08235 [Paludibacteraceae bacterium]|nr:hypothetical protein [Paludibacteraceae bacterium]